MFTGLISHLGNVQTITTGTIFRLSIDCADIVPKLTIGASVAVNGVCLTTVEIKKPCFIVELSPETLRLTNFRTIQNQAKVNLEFPLKLSDPLGGHLVQGHVDGVSRLIKKEQHSGFLDLFFSIPQNLNQYLIHKGSITVNGVSLTISSIDQECFGVSLIPETLKKTNLSLLEIGDFINLEVDMIAKYIEKMLPKKA